MALGNNLRVRLSSHGHRWRDVVLPLLQLLGGRHAGLLELLTPQKSLLKESSQDVKASEDSSKESVPSETPPGPSCSDCGRRRRKTCRPLWGRHHRSLCQVRTFCLIKEDAQHFTSYQSCSWKCHIWIVFCHEDPSFSLRVHTQQLALDWEGEVPAPAPLARQHSLLEFGKQCIFLSWKTFGLGKITQSKLSGNILYWNLENIFLSWKTFDLGKITQSKLSGNILSWKNWPNQSCQAAFSWWRVSGSTKAADALRGCQRGN